ncbi:hypothetical protein CFP71_40525 [Amycolatopsis thailandensis]|uniref:Uncharacterized protein n=1 Tax=Amycolatopsis thailandensis TaxID=589330 RepID=A0A229RC60_9PSEU|nr:hypothetical protein [Amycolatopsis thailandensis]OXM44242.1 hypothetical protein CFP71_40525 [Amycolatopsis thailandensis]
MTSVHVRRYAYQDQHPAGTDLRAAALTSLRNYARHYGLTFNPDEVRTTTGYRWHRSDPDNPDWNGRSDVRGVRADVRMYRKPLPPTQNHTILVSPHD